jgi:hypothetical protein
MDFVKLFDFNSSLFLMGCVCNTAIDCVEQLQCAFVAAKPAIAKEVAGLRAEHDVLEQQRQFITTGLGEVASFVETKMTDELVAVVQQQLSSFFAKRLDEIRFVLEGRELVWFKSNQTATVVEMQSAFRKLERFTAAYVQQRTFLTSKMERGEKSLGGWSFLDENSAAVLKAMQAEQQELVCGFSRRVSHHVKDEFDRSIGGIMSAVREKKHELLAQFVAMCNPMLEQAEERLQRECGIDTAVNIAADTMLLEPNERRINNFLRELPEHVASAAVEIGNQWFAPLSASDTPSDAARSAGPDDADVSGDGGHHIDRNLLFVLEAWRLTFSSIEPYQLCKYNIHEVEQSLQVLHGHAADFLTSYVGELDAGIASIHDLVAELMADGQELEEIEASVAPVADWLQCICSRLRDMLEGSVERASQKALEEQDLGTH